MILKFIALYNMVSRVWGERNEEGLLIIDVTHKQGSDYNLYAIDLLHSVREKNASKIGLGFWAEKITVLDVFSQIEGEVIVSEWWSQNTLWLAEFG